MAADSRHNASYLSTYEGGAVRPGFNIPQAAAPRAIAGMAQDVGVIGHLGNQFSEIAQVYSQSVIQRQSRDEDLRADELFREMRIKDAALRGKDADNLYYKRKEALPRLREDFIKKSPLGGGISGYIFDKHAGHYLDWAGNHMLTEGRKAERQSRANAAGNLIKKASEMMLNTIALQELYRQAHQLISDDPQRASELINEISRQALASKVDLSPGAVTQMLVDSREFFVKELGLQNYNKLQDYILQEERDSIQRTNQREAQARKDLEEDQKRILGTAKDWIADHSGGETDNAAWDEAQWSAMMEELQVPAQVIPALKKFRTESSAASAKDTNPEVNAMLNRSEPLTLQDLWLVDKSELKGTTTKQTRQWLKQLYDFERRAADKKFTLQLNNAKTALKSAISTTSANPGLDPLYIQALGGLMEAADGMTYAERVHEFDPNNKDGLLFRQSRLLTEAANRRGIVPGVENQGLTSEAADEFKQLPSSEWQNALEDITRKHLR